ncbi:MULTISPECIES: hypothetical protein [unclassified Arthrobacter]|uniref:hypothetical protein n=1 Tax=unclassified Arthrobacter TaxID=235627 RepID=UPI0033982A6D
MPERRTTGLTDVVLAVLPQFHVGGWNIQPLLAWWAGALSGEVREMDPTVAAWALMGIGELIGMRRVLWDEEGAHPIPGTRPDVPEEVFEEPLEGNAP